MTSQRDVIRSAVAFLFAGASASALADLASQLRDFVGYTVLEVKTIAGWRDAEWTRKCLAEDRLCLVAL